MNENLKIWNWGDLGGLNGMKMEVQNVNTDSPFKNCHEFIVFSVGGIETMA